MLFVTKVILHSTLRSSPSTTEMDFANLLTRKFTLDFVELESGDSESSSSESSERNRGAFLEI